MNPVVKYPYVWTVTLLKANHPGRKPRPYLNQSNQIPIFLLSRGLRSTAVILQIALHIPALQQSVGTEHTTSPVKQWTYYSTCRARRVVVPIIASGANLVYTKCKCLIKANNFCNSCLSQMCAHMTPARLPSNVPSSTREAKRSAVKCGCPAQPIDPPRLFFFRIEQMNKEDRTQNCLYQFRSGSLFLVPTRVCPSRNTHAWPGARTVLHGR